MSEPIKDGGSAFPLAVPAGTIGSGCGPHNEWGMSLRDYFAAKAMAAFIAGGQDDKAAYNHSGKCAEWAYAQADAMLEARDAK